jgi:hypothetical protein
MTVTDLAKAVDASDGAVTNWIYGYAKPREMFRIRLAKVLSDKLSRNITMDDVIEEQGLTSTILKGHTGNDKSLGAAMKTEIESILTSAETLGIDEAKAWEYVARRFRREFHIS